MGIYGDLHSLFRGQHPNLFPLYCFLPPPPNHRVCGEKWLGSKDCEIRLPDFGNPSFQPRAGRVTLAKLPNLSEPQTLPPQNEVVVTPAS